MYTTFIFDLDGTLLNTLDDLAASVNYALRTHGMPEHSVDEVRQFVGNGVRKLMLRAVPDADNNPKFEETFQTFREHYMKHSMDSTRPYDGIQELLQALKKQGKHLAVVSNKFYAATQELCQHFFADTIEVAIGEHEAEGIRKKPAPDTVMEALRQLGVGKEGAVYVGDSDVDIMTARNSGLPCISVLWGFRDKDFLKNKGATTFVAAPKDILSI
jgi:phosphoglycolate phosphatase